MAHYSYNPDTSQWEVVDGLAKIKEAGGEWTEVSTFGDLLAYIADAYAAGDKMKVTLRKKKGA